MPSRSPWTRRSARSQIRECPRLPPTVAERIRDYRARNVADSAIVSLFKSVETAGGAKRMVRSGLATKMLLAKGINYRWQ